MNNPLDKVYLSEANLNTIANGGSITSGDDSYSADEEAIYLVPDNNEIALTNLGTITSTEIVNGAFYRNNIAVSGGISVGDIIFVQMSNNAVYPTINNNATQLVIFNGSDLSALTITKAWKMK